MLRVISTIIFLLGSAVGAFAQALENTPRPSICQAIAYNIPKAQFATFEPNAFNAINVASKHEVSLTYVGHSTYFIETPGGVTIATDYSGAHRPSELPQVVTMNKAHSSHYTMIPDPGIKYVLHGWDDEQNHAEYSLVVGDTFIRNVPTDIRAYGGEMEANGNSIFIFETAGLCIGHLGHLHHELTDSHFAQIGRLDVVMVPIDGGLTMGAISMGKMIKRLRSSLILPMHRRYSPIENFLAQFDDSFAVKFSRERSVTVSLRDLPKQPTILILQGV